MHDLPVNPNDINIRPEIQNRRRTVSKYIQTAMRHCIFCSFFFLILSLIFMACRNDQKDNNSMSNRSGRMDSSNPSAIPVQAAAVKRGDISTFLMQTTTIEAERQVDIMAKVSGQVVKLPAEEGLRVKKDDLLVQLDEAELKINYMRSKVSYETDKSVYERSKEMLEKTYISAEDYEAARLQYERSKSEYEAAELQLEYSSVRAPFDGIVTARHIELGQRVNVNQSLFTIADFNPLRAKIYVPEKDISSIYEGQDATITVEAQPGIKFKGVVKMISPVVDPESGTSKVTIDITDDRGKLKPGMFASVFITTDTHKNTLIIPKRSLVLETDLDQVYIYRDGKARKVSLKTGFSSGDDLEILEGLQEGDLVVTAGQDGLREGLPIRIPGMEADMPNRTTDDLDSSRMAANLADQNHSSTQSENSSFDPERLKRMEERLLKNPEIKKEYEKRLKKDPELKSNPKKKMAFFREMQQKMQNR